VAAKVIPRLSIFLQGVLQNHVPEAPKRTGGRLALRLNGRVQAVLPLPANYPNETTSPTGDDEEEEGGDNDLVDQVNRLIAGENDRDSEDGPDWMFEDGEKTSSNPDYVFCPVPHRKQLLHLFTKHFCQHPLFPERRANSLTADEIRRSAVFEMYEFCHTRGLREVWGYMWACWYNPKMWKLWARSSSPYLSRLRTTMGVENFWRQLKHNYLHNVVRPRLDHLVWILIYKVTPTYYARADILDDTYRLGRSKTLTTYQRAFKKSWINLSKKTISGQPYITDIPTWICNCGQQKYQSHHLCKHLVQAVLMPEKRFFRTVVRRRVVPIYRHPSLVVKGLDGQTAFGKYTEPDGGITDGDDNVWSGDKKVLEGDGGWHQLTQKKNPLGQHYIKSGPVVASKKRRREEVEDDEVHEGTERNSLGQSSMETMTNPPEIVDLTMSSPIISAQEELPASEPDGLRGDSSAFEYGSGDELEVNFNPF